MLRAKARKSYQQTSHFRGVSLLKQTNKWHAQINVGGKQVSGQAPDPALGVSCGLLTGFPVAPEQSAFLLKVGGNVWGSKRRTLLWPQVHLGFFPTEEFAARAYDRAAINKGAKEPNKGKITTNFDIMDYVDELDLLRRISQEDLIEALSNEG